MSFNNIQGINTFYLVHNGVRVIAKGELMGGQVSSKETILTFDNQELLDNKIYDLGLIDLPDPE